jgi:hypothetical protein
MSNRISNPDGRDRIMRKLKRTKKKMIADGVPKEGLKKTRKAIRRLKEEE